MKKLILAAILVSVFSIPAFAGVVDPIPNNIEVDEQPINNIIAKSHGTQLVVDCSKSNIHCANTGGAVEVDEPTINHTVIDTTQLVVDCSKIYLRCINTEGINSVDLGVDTKSINLHAVGYGTTNATSNN